MKEIQAFSVETNVNSVKKYRQRPVAEKIPIHLNKGGVSEKDWKGS